MRTEEGVYERKVRKVSLKDNKIELGLVSLKTKPKLSNVLRLLSSCKLFNCVNYNTVSTITMYFAIPVSGFERDGR